MTQPPSLSPSSLPFKEMELRGSTEVAMFGLLIHRHNLFYLDLSGNVDVLALVCVYVYVCRFSCLSLFLCSSVCHWGPNIQCECCFSTRAGYIPQISSTCSAYSWTKILAERPRTQEKMPFLAGLGRQLNPPSPLARVCMGVRALAYAAPAA